MKSLHFDASAGVSGDMILAALLDLGVSHAEFKNKMQELKLPLQIEIKEAKRASLRALRVEVHIEQKKQTPRKFDEIESLLKRSNFSEEVKKKSVAIFKKMFEAEAKVHGISLDEAHLHEAGADDAILDIAGTCYLLEKLGIDEVTCTPLNLGGGWVKTSHGVLPVPAPAVTELLRNFPVYSNWVNEELVTPTGAAIISSLVKEIIQFPEISFQKVGYGAGKRNFENFPNVLRAFYAKKSNKGSLKKIFVIETNVDDSNPQILASFFETAFRLGALDVYASSILMKKNRLATKLTILAEAERIDSLIHAIFKETSSIGVRYFPVERRILERETKRIEIFGESVKIKVSYFEGKEVNLQPEFSDCVKLAKKLKIPVKEVYLLALEECSKLLKKNLQGMEEE